MVVSFRSTRWYHSVYPSSIARAAARIDLREQVVNFPFAVSDYADQAMVEIDSSSIPITSILVVQPTKSLDLPGEQLIGDYFVTFIGSG